MKKLENLKNKEEIIEAIQGEGLTVEPNFIRVYMGWFVNLFWDYFVYVDREDYVMDSLLINNKIPVKFMNTEFVSPDGKFHICTVRVRHKYKDKLIDEIFPALHKKLMVLEGKEYENLCRTIVEKLINMMIGE